MMAGDQESKRPKFVFIQYNGTLSVCAHVVCVCTCLYTHAHAHAHAHAHVHARARARAHTRMHAYIHTHTHTHTGMCVNVYNFSYACIHVRVWVYVCARHVYALTHAHTHTHTHTHTGPSLGGMAKARTGAQKPEVEKIMGQHHVFYFADGLSTHTRHAREDKIRSDRHTLFLSLRDAHTHTHTHTHTQMDWYFSLPPSLCKL